MKKVLSLLLAVMMISSLFSAVTVFAGSNTVVVDGVTFSKDMQILVKYHVDKKDESYTIPDSVTIIEGGAFYNNSHLKNVVIPNSVTSIESHAFSGCTSLTGVTIPNSVTSIGDSAFSGCTSLTGVTIPNSVTSIGEKIFYDCTSLAGITIPNSVTSIGWYAFSYCTSLTSITIPNSVTWIGGWAFSGCRSLTSITIPNSVTSIGDGAFSGCTSLTGITIPNSVTSIGHGAFSICTSLTDVYYDATEIEWNSISVGSYNSFLQTANIHFSEPDKSEIKVTLNGKKLSFDQPPVIENGRTLVPLRAIFEALGAEIAWDSETQTIRAIRYGTYVELQIGSNEMKVNSEIKVLDVPAKTINDRTMVPARAIAEAFGCSVSWDADNNAVIIN